MEEIGVTARLPGYTGNLSASMVSEKFGHSQRKVHPPALSITAVSLVTVQARADTASNPFPVQTKIGAV